MGLQKDAMTLFGTRDFYKILGVKRGVRTRNILQGAYTRIMAYCATNQDKCRVLYDIMFILTDKASRERYDMYEKCKKIDTGCDVCSFENIFSMCVELMGMSNGPYEMNNPFGTFINHYQFSKLEEYDAQRAYIVNRGCMLKMLQSVPLMTIRDERRMRHMIGNLVAVKQLPRHLKFFTDSAKQRRIRHLLCKHFTDEVKQLRSVKKVVLKYGRDRLDDEYEKFKQIIRANKHRFRGAVQQRSNASEEDDYDTDDCIAQLDPDESVGSLITKYGIEVVIELKRFQSLNQR